MGKPLNLIGQSFGRLTVKEKSSKRDQCGNVYWHCVCVCGNSHEVKGYLLKNGECKSCGCLFLEVAAQKGKKFITHGMTKSRAYKSWSGMKERCLNPKNKNFKNYGGRGITICKEWIKSFDNFLSDMGEPPKNHSLDRINVNGNYEPSNCRWANAITQCNNKRNNLIIYGISMAQYCRLNNLNADKVQQRLKRRYTLQRALMP